MKEAVTTNPVRRLWLISEFRRALDGDRQSLINGLPALMIGVAACGFAWHVSSIPEVQRVARYHKMAALGTEPGNHQSVLLCTERLMQEPKADLKQAYVNAMIHQADGNLAEAESMLSQLAPTEATGYPPAQLSLAQSLLTRKGVRDEATLRIVERHLEHAMEGREVANEARILLGRIYAATGRGRRAEPYLRPATKEQPEFYLILARAANEQGDIASAAADLERAIGVFRDRALAYPEDIEARLLWADALWERSDFVGVVAILERGLARSNDSRYHHALARAYANLANNVAGNDSAAVGERLAMLERGFVHAPNDSALLDQLAAIIRVGGEDIGRARSILQSQLTAGKATVTTHFLLGWDAFSRGRGDEARLHWEQAVRLAPDSAVLANNLAWVLASAQPADLTRALELANRAIERKPNQPDFHHTRGIVLMKLERWPEALTDLEAALAGGPDPIETHISLAQVYDKLGMPELASQHRDRAASKQKLASGQAPAALQATRPK
jgi:tetratricopeptide (TPR) repeat protein